MHTVTECQPAWLDDIRASYNDNSHATKWIHKLHQAPDPKQRFSWRNNLLYFRDHIWLGGSEKIQTQILTAFHASVTGGHSGFPATYARIRRLFAWPKMKNQTKAFVQSCMTCQQAKPECVKYPGLLEPLPTPEAA